MSEADKETETARTVKMPKRLWDKLRKIADTEHRTINGQLCAMIEEAKDRG